MIQELLHGDGHDGAETGDVNKTETAVPEVEHMQRAKVELGIYKKEWGRRWGRERGGGAVCGLMNVKICSAT